MGGWGDENHRLSRKPGGFYFSYLLDKFLRRFGMEKREPFSFIIMI
jgi:hypothetical protein